MMMIIITMLELRIIIITMTIMRRKKHFVDSVFVGMKMVIN